MELGLTYCGDPEAFYGWPTETQERVLGWWRAKHAKPEPKRGASKAQGTSAARDFWGVG